MTTIAELRKEVDDLWRKAIAKGWVTINGNHVLIREEDSRALAAEPEPIKGTDGLILHRGKNYHKFWESVPNQNKLRMVVDVHNPDQVIVSNQEIWALHNDLIYAAETGRGLTDIDEQARNIRRAHDYARLTYTGGPNPSLECMTGGLGGGVALTHENQRERMRELGQLLLSTGMSPDVVMTYYTDDAYILRSKISRKSLEDRWPRTLGELAVWKLNE